MTHVIPLCFLLLGMVAAPAAAQYIPMPGGQYPGGDRPEMGTPRAPSTPSADFRGTVKSVSSKKLTIEMADSNMVDFRLSKKTVYYRGDKQVKLSAVEAGATVSVEARRAGDNELSALTVRIETPRS